MICCCCWLITFYQELKRQRVLAITKLLRIIVADYNSKLTQSDDNISHPAKDFAIKANATIRWVWKLLASEDVETRRCLLFDCLGSRKWWVEQVLVEENCVWSSDFCEQSSPMPLSIQTFSNGRAVSSADPMPSLANSAIRFLWDRLEMLTSAVEPWLEPIIFLR